MEIVATHEDTPQVCCAALSSEVCLGCVTAIRNEIGPPFTFLDPNTTTELATMASFFIPTTVQGFWTGGWPGD